MTYRAVLVSGLLVTAALVGCSPQRQANHDPFAGGNAAALTLQSAPSPSPSDFGLPSNAWPGAAARTARLGTKPPPPLLDSAAAPPAQGPASSAGGHAQQPSTPPGPQYYVATGKMKPVPEKAISQDKKAPSDSATAK